MTVDPQRNLAWGWYQPPDQPKDPAAPADAAKTVSGSLPGLAAFIGAPATTWTLVGLFGTAGTGMGISSLSGAAFTAATAAWLGRMGISGITGLGIRAAPAVLGGIGLAISLPIQVAIGAKVAGNRERKTISQIKDTTQVIDAQHTIIDEMQPRLEDLGSQAREQNLQLLSLRDLPSKRLHVFEPGRVPKPLTGLTGSKIREDVIVRNWPDILRVAAILASGTLPPSQLLRKFAAYPRQHELAVALGEIGRVERTLFIVDWLLDADMQRRANTGLNKGEAHHALKNALRIGRQGEIRDRSSEGQHYRLPGLNPLAAIVIHWNTVHLGEAVRQRKRAGLTVEPELLAHISPLGWAHILRTGEYRWPKRQ